MKKREKRAVSQKIGQERREAKLKRECKRKEIDK